MSFLSSLFGGGGGPVGGGLGSMVGTPGFNPMADDLLAQTRAMQLPQSQMEQPFQPNIGIPGMLGIKGGFRDALGAIGDALLVGNDMAPMYQQEKQRQQINHAMQDFATDPMAAIARVAEIDPMKAREMLMERQEAEAQNAQRQSAADKNVWDSQGKALDMLGTLAGAANEATFPAIQQRLIDISQRGGLGLEEVIKNARTPEELANIAQGAISAKDRATLQDNREYRQSRLEDFDRAEERQRGEAASRNRQREFQQRDKAERTSIYRTNIESQVKNRGKTSSGGKSGGKAKERKIGGKTYVEVGKNQWRLKE